MTIALLVLSGAIQLAPATGGQAASGPDFETLAKKATAARVGGRLDEAIALYRKALALEPKWPEGHWYLGTLLYEKDAFADARAALQPLVEFDPKNGPAWAFLGLCEFGLKRYAAALQSLDRGRELGLGSNESLIRVAAFHSAILHNRASHFDAATELLVRLARSQSANPDLVLALGLNLLKRPLLPSQVPSGDKDLVGRAGQAAYAQATGKYEDARRAFESLHAANGAAPGVEQAYRAYLAGYAVAIQDKEQREQAIAQFRGRLAEAPDDPEAKLYLGLLLEPAKSVPASATPSPGATPAGFAALAEKAAAARDANRSAEAIALYREALGLRPSWDEGVFYLGTLLYEGGQTKEARQEFLRFVNLRPEAGAGWAFVGLCEFRLQDFAEALSHLSRGRDLGLGDNESLMDTVRYHIAILLSRREEFEAALQILMAFAAKGNDTPGVIEALGIATLRLPRLPAEVPLAEKPVVAEAGRAAFYQGARRIPESMKAYEDLARTHPGHPNVHYAFAVFLLSEDPERALEEFRRELLASPSHVFARLHLAFEYIKRSDYDAALPFAEAAARMAPQNLAARNALGRVLVEKGDLERGIVELEAGVRIAPDSPEMHFALARAYAKAGRTADAEKARTEFRRLLELRKAAREAPPGVLAATQPPQPEPVPK
jgi:tetratricopeptide (TPR) repeat protein